MVPDILDNSLREVNVEVLGSACLIFKLVSPSKLAVSIKLIPCGSLETKKNTL